MSEYKLMFIVYFSVPERYSYVTLPQKLPPKKQPLSVAGLPMLGYLEQTVATAIVKSLTAVGASKPKHPFLSPTKSALIYVAYHLKGTPHFLLILNAAVNDTGQERTRF